MPRQRRGSQGYQQIRRDGQKVYKHRWLMEQHLGRKLERREHVHHINGDVKDNRIENLEIVTPAEHAAIHIKGLVRGPARRARIVAMREAGISQSEIARRLGTPQSVVSRHLKRQRTLRPMAANTGGQ